MPGAVRGAVVNRGLRATPTPARTAPARNDQIGGADLSVLIRCRHYLMYRAQQRWLMSGTSAYWCLRGVGLPVPLAPIHRASHKTAMLPQIRLGCWPKSAGSWKEEVFYKLRPANKTDRLCQIMAIMSNVH